MEELRAGRNLASIATATQLPTRREVLQRELHAERRRLGHLIHEHGLPGQDGGRRSSPRRAATVMMLLLSYKIRDLAAELAALDSNAAGGHP